MMTDYEKKLVKNIRTGEYGAIIFETVVVLGVSLLFRFVFNASNTVLYFCIGIWAVMVVYFLVIAKKSIDAITKNPPIECEVYDFLIWGQGKSYDKMPIMRNIVTGELYFTFGNHDLSLNRTVEAKSPELVSDMKILRDDNSELQVGDPVSLYIKRFFDPKLHIEPNDDHYFLDGANRRFINIVPEHDISVMNEVKFFEGYVDVREQKPEGREFLK